MNPGDPVNTPQNFPFERTQVQAGFCVLKKGQKVAEMIYVEEGALEAFDDEKILYNIPQGSLIGVTSVMDSTPFECNVRAGKPAVIVRINQAAMAQVFKATPNWMVAMISSLSKRTQQLKQSAVKPIYKSSLESFVKFLAIRTGRYTLETSSVLKEYMWQSRASKEETMDALKELLKRKFIKLEPGDDGKPNSKLVTVKPKLLNILCDYLRYTRHGEVYPAFGLSEKERASLEVLGLEDSLFTKTREEWLSYLQKAISDADIIVLIKFMELGIFTEVENSKKLFLDTNVLDQFLSAIHAERSIKGLV